MPGAIVRSALTWPSVDDADESVASFEQPTQAPAASPPKSSILTIVIVFMGVSPLSERPSGATLRFAATAIGNNWVPVSWRDRLLSMNLALQAEVGAPDAGILEEL